MSCQEEPFAYGEVAETAAWATNEKCRFGRGRILRSGSGGWGRRRREVPVSQRESGALVTGWD
jgi:hypothetical protein